MSSEFAKDLSSKLAVDIPDDIMQWGQKQIDTALAPVREVLDGLSTYTVAGLPCWCESRHTPDSRDALDDDDHRDPCQRARELYSSLEIKE